MDCSDDSSFEVLDLGRSDNLKTTDEYVLVPRPDFESMDEAQTKINELKTALSKEKRNTRKIQIQNQVYENKVIIYNRCYESVRDDLDKTMSEKKDLKRKMINTEIKMKTKLNDLMQMEEAYYLRDLCENKSTDDVFFDEKNH